jgi:hypothetical protein
VVIHVPRMPKPCFAVFLLNSLHAFIVDFLGTENKISMFDPASHNADEASRMRNVASAKQVTVYSKYVIYPYHYLPRHSFMIHVSGENCFPILTCL